MSGIDRPSDGDSVPDRLSGREDRPFPGAPADREPVSAPGPSPSMDQMRAAFANADSNRDIEASAKADEAAAARGSDTGTADPGVSGSAAEGTAAGGDGQGVRGTQAGVQDGAVDPGTAVPGTVVPESGEPDGPYARSDGPALAGEVGQPEGAARPERTDIPAFPGASLDRAPAPAPDPAPSMEQMRDAFARSSTSDELLAAARADEAAAGEAPAGKGAAAAKPGGDAVAAREAAAPRGPAAGDSGEQRGEEAGSGAAEETAPEQPVVLRAPQQEMPAAEAPEGEPVPLDGGRPEASLEHQPDARQEDVVVPGQGEDAEAAEPAAEGTERAKDGVAATRSDAAAPEADDKPVVAGVVEPERAEAGLSPEERETGETNATRSEVRLDTQSDDQRPATVAEMKVLVAEMMAENNAKLDAMEARHKAEVDELKTKLEAAKSEQHPVREGTQAEEDQAASAPEKQPDGEVSPERNPDSNENPDVSDAEQRADRLPRGVTVPEQVPDDPRIVQRQDALLDEEASREESSARRASFPRLRGLITSENVSAVSTVGGAVDTAVQLFGHATPEGIVGVGFTLLGVAGLGLAKMEKRRKEKKEKDDRPD